MHEDSTFFAPMIYLNEVAPAIEFYKGAFDAIGLRRWSNDDDSVHIAEMSIYGALFHMHDEVTRTNEFSPGTLKALALQLAYLSVTRTQ